MSEEYQGNQQSDLEEGKDGMSTAIPLPIPSSFGYALSYDPVRQMFVLYHQGYLYPFSLSYLLKHIIPDLIPSSPVIHSSTTIPLQEN